MLRWDVPHHRTSARKSNARTTCAALDKRCSFSFFYLAVKVDFLHVVVQGAGILVTPRRQPSVATDLAKNVVLALAVLKRAKSRFARKGF